MAKTRFHGLLEEKVRKRIDDISVEIVGGRCADYANYLRQVGYISGLTDALKLADEVESEENG